jgi:type II secretory pathway pseudopilin PulG
LEIGGVLIKHVRDYEELISLQDKAIQALQQANLALQLALSALQKARAEAGFAPPIPFYANPGSSWQGQYQTWSGTFPQGLSGGVSSMGNVQGPYTDAEMKKFKALYSEYEKKNKLQ